MKKKYITFAVIFVILFVIFCEFLYSFILTAKVHYVLESTISTTDVDDDILYNKLKSNIDRKSFDKLRFGVIDDVKLDSGFILILPSAIFGDQHDYYYDFSFYDYTSRFHDYTVYYSIHVSGFSDVYIYDVTVHDNNL